MQLNPDESFLPVSPLLPADTSLFSAGDAIFSSSPLDAFNSGEERLNLVQNPTPLVTGGWSDDSWSGNTDELPLEQTLIHSPIQSGGIWGTVHDHSQDIDEKPNVDGIGSNATSSCSSEAALSTPVDMQPVAASQARLDDSATAMLTGFSSSHQHQQSIFLQLQPPVQAAQLQLQASTSQKLSASLQSESQHPAIASQPTIAKRACISCRQSKMSCENVRPCARCIKHGRQCVDRTEAEIAATRKRRGNLKASPALAQYPHRQLLQGSSTPGLPENSSQSPSLATHPLDLQGLLQLATYSPSSFDAAGPMALSPQTLFLATSGLISSASSTSPQQPLNQAVVTAAAPLLSLPSHPQPIAKRACISCRLSKMSCDDVRPCARCARNGRQCLDRSDAEIAAARKKRKNAEDQPSVTGVEAPISAGVEVPISAAVAAAPAVPRPDWKRKQSAPHDLSVATPCAYSPSPVYSAESECSRAWSRMLLSALTRSGLRDFLLKCFIELDALPLHLPTMLELQANLVVVLTCCADMMEVDDFETFLTQGLEPELLASPLWMGSSLCQWSKVQTRPFHFTVIPVTKQECVSILGAEYLFQWPRHWMQWDPLATGNHTRWKSMLVAKLQYDEQVKMRRRGTMQHNITDQQGHFSLNYMQAPTVSSSSSQPTASVSTADDEVDNLICQFTTFDILNSLLEPADRDPREEIDLPHATWCPLSKAGRLTSGSSSGSASCLCAMSACVPYRLLMNRAQEDFLGWSHEEIQQKVSRWGHRTQMFYLQPECWQLEIQHEVEHWTSNLRPVGEKAVAAARALVPGAVPMASHPQLKLPTRQPQEQSYRNSRGEPISCQFRKTIHVQPGNTGQLPAIVVTCTPTFASGHMTSHAVQSTTSRESERSSQCLQQ